MAEERVVTVSCLEKSDGVIEDLITRRILLRRIGIAAAAAGVVSAGLVKVLWPMTAPIPRPARRMSAHRAPGQAPAPPPAETTRPAAHRVVTPRAGTARPEMAPAETQLAALPRQVTFKVEQRAEAAIKVRLGAPPRVEQAKAGLESVETAASRSGETAPAATAGMRATAEMAEARSVAPPGAATVATRLVRLTSRPQAPDLAALEHQAHLEVPAALPPRK